MTIVTTHYRYKRPPKKQKAVPVVVKAVDPATPRHFLCGSWRISR
jgi:hypothetical protein